MLAKRIIPCLDVKNGRVVKGINFLNLRDAGDPVEIAAGYSDAGADEVVFLDITATLEGRKTMIDVVNRTAEKVFIPLTVGGGISTVEDMTAMLHAGADKVSINTAAVKNPELITRGSDKFGAQCIVIAIDAKRYVVNGKNTWRVHINAGKTPTELDVIEWAQRVEKLGSGEILLTSMDCDGTKDGYDLELTAKVSDTVNIPVIASGGAGTLEHLYDALVKGKADAVLAASIFHYGEFTVKQTKDYLRDKKVVVRT
ncbi:MAG: imidazole glycerol phosphate synthase subunit HisF [Elusimicrobiota bacterium]